MTDKESRNKLNGQDSIPPKIMGGIPPVHSKPVILSKKPPRHSTSKKLPFEQEVTDKHNKISEVSSYKAPGPFPVQESRSEGEVPGGYPNEFLYNQTFKDSDTSLLFFLNIFFIKWKLIILVIIFSLTAGWLYLRSQDPFFMATSTIRMIVRKPRIMKQDEALLDDVNYKEAKEVLNTRMYILRNKSVRNQVFEYIKTHYPELDVRDDFLRATIANVTLTPLRNTRLVHISLISENKSVVIPIVNSYAHVSYISVHDDIKKRYNAAVKWLREQSFAQREKVKEIKRSLMKFRKEYKIDSIESEKLATKQLLISLNESLVNLNTKITLSRGMVEALSKTRNPPNNTGQLPSTVPYADQIQSHLKDIDKAVKKKNLLLVRYTEKHPEVKKLSKEIFLLQEQLNNTIIMAGQTAKADLNLVEQQYKNLILKKQKEKKHLQAVEKKIAVFNAEFEKLKAEVKTDELTLSQLLKRVEEARLSTEENTTIISIVQEANNPPKTVLPKALEILMIAALLGLAGGCGIAYLLHNYEDLIYDLSTVEYDMGIPLVGVVPHVKGKLNIKDLSTMCMDGKSHIITETFAGIRTKLNTLLKKTLSKGYTLIITGITPSEGKTSTSCNLAITIAQSGKQVLIIDGDMRKPVLHKIFNVSKKELSLIDALKEITSIQLEKIPLKTNIPNLSLIHGYTSIKNFNPSKALSADHLKRLLEWASTKYDYVIVDTPPVGVFSDGMIFGAVADNVLMICRCEKSRKAIVQHGIKDLTKSGSNIIGIIVCDILFSRFPSKLGYGKYYGNYYNNYQYYNNYNNEKSSG